MSTSIVDRNSDLGLNSLDVQKYSADILQQIINDFPGSLNLFDAYVAKTSELDLNRQLNVLIGLGSIDLKCFNDSLNMTYSNKLRPEVLGKISGVIVTIHTQKIYQAEINKKNSQLEKSESELKKIKEENDQLKKDCKMSIFKKGLLVAAGITVGLAGGVLIYHVYKKRQKGSE